MEKLRNTCPPDLMQCESTKELSPLDEIIGQERAVRALKFGLGIKNHGFNMYVAGYPGTGRKTTVKSFVEAQAKTQPVPLTGATLTISGISTNQKPYNFRREKAKNFEMT